MYDGDVETGTIVVEYDKRKKYIVFLGWKENGKTDIKNSLMRMMRTLIFGTNCLVAKDI